MNEMNDDRGRELDELRTKLMKENHFLKSLASKPLSVYFDAYRNRFYETRFRHKTFRTNFRPAQDDQMSYVEKASLNIHCNPFFGHDM
jgi:hypothetical protein